MSKFLTVEREQIPSKGLRPMSPSGEAVEREFQNLKEDLARNPLSPYKTDPARGMIPDLPDEGAGSKTAFTRLLRKAKAEFTKDQRFTVFSRKRGEDRVLFVGGVLDPPADYRPKKRK